MTSFYIMHTFEQLRWCVEQFGKEYEHHLIYFQNFSYFGKNGQDTRRWNYDDTHIHFKNKEDAMLFKLRWL